MHHPMIEARPVHAGEYEVIVLPRWACREPFPGVSRRLRPQGPTGSSLRPVVRTPDTDLAGAVRPLSSHGDCARGRKCTRTTDSYDSTVRARRGRLPHVLVGRVSRHTGSCGWVARRAPQRTERPHRSRVRTRGSGRARQACSCWCRSRPLGTRGRGRTFAPRADPGRQDANHTVHHCRWWRSRPRRALRPGKARPSPEAFPTP